MLKIFLKSVFIIFSCYISNIIVLFSVLYLFKLTLKIYLLDAHEFDAMMSMNCQGMCAHLNCLYILTYTVYCYSNR